VVEGVRGTAAVDLRTHRNTQNRYAVWILYLVVLAMVPRPACPLPRSRCGARRDPIWRGGAAPAVSLRQLTSVPSIASTLIAATTLAFSRVGRLLYYQRPRPSLSSVFL